MRLWLAALLAAGSAQALELSLPVDCGAVGGCFVQNHVDRDPGPGAQDFTCGPMSYDGHKGVDFRTVTIKDLEAGIPILAAAPGVIQAVRDGLPDTGVEGAVPQQGCGNAVVIDHKDGWRTLYCHLEQGSVSVAAGDQVRRGDPLGLMGFSGNTAFPHLHFEVLKDGAALDPFAPEPGACGAGDALWAEGAGAVYRPGGVLDVGLTSSAPDFGDIQAGAYGPSDVDLAAPPLIVWGWWFGLRKGDRVTLRLTGPDGMVAEREEVMSRDRAQQFYYTGRKQRGGWPRGVYAYEAALLRDGQVVERRAGRFDR